MIRLLVCFTITMIKSIPKSHLWVHSAYFSLHFLVTINHRAKSRQELKTRTEIKTEMLLTSSFSGSCLDSFLLQAKSDC